MDVLQLPGEFQNVRVSVFSVWPPKIRPQTGRIYEQQGILASPVPNPFTSWRGQSKASSHLHFPFLVLMTPPACTQVDRPNGSLALKVAFYSPPGHISKVYLASHSATFHIFKATFLVRLELGNAIMAIIQGHTRSGIQYSSQQLNVLNLPFLCL